MKGFHTCRGERVAVGNGTRATIKVPTHRATPPPPLQMSELLKRADKKLTLESVTPPLRMSELLKRADKKSTRENAPPALTDEGASQAG